MTRFENLEFEEESEILGSTTSRPARKQTGTPIRDAAYFKREADNAYLRNEYELALQNYSRALEDDHTLFSCWFGQVRMLFELNEYKEADLWSEKALELFPNHPDLLSAKALASLFMGLDDIALALSDNAMSQRTPSPYCWIVRGEILLNRNSKMADHCCTQAIAHCDTQQKKGRIAIELSKVFRRRGHLSKALGYASDGIKVFPDDASAWLEYGTCQSLLGLREAGESLNQALKLNPESKTVASALESWRKRGIVGRLRSIFGRS